MPTEAENLRRVQNLEARVETLEGKVKAMEAKDSQQNTTITSLVNAVNALKVAP